MDKVIVKLENENERLQKVVATLNGRIGDETVFDDDDEPVNSDMELSYSTAVNTRYYQLDSSFGKIFYYITNVSMSGYKIQELYD